MQAKIKNAKKVRFVFIAITCSSPCIPGDAWLRPYNRSLARRARGVLLLYFKRFGFEALDALVVTLTLFRRHIRLESDVSAVLRRGVSESQRQVRREPLLGVGKS